MTRGKETFIVEKTNTHTHTEKEKKTRVLLLRVDKKKAQRDQIILHLIHMHVSVKALHFVYLHCVRLVSAAERKGNRKRNSASKTREQSEASSLSINVNRVLEFCIDPVHHGSWLSGPTTL